MNLVRARGLIGIDTSESSLKIQQAWNLFRINLKVMELQGGKIAPPDFTLLYSIHPHTSLHLAEEFQPDFNHLAGETTHLASSIPNVRQCLDLELLEVGGSQDRSQFTQNVTGWGICWHVHELVLDVALFCFLQSVPQIHRSSPVVGHQSKVGASQVVLVRPVMFTLIWKRAAAAMLPSSKEDSQSLIILSSCKGLEALPGSQFVIANQPLLLRDVGLLRLSFRQWAGRA